MSAYRLLMRSDDKVKTTRRIPARRIRFGLIGAALVSLALLIAWFALTRSDADDLSPSDEATLLQLARQQLAASLSGNGLIDVAASTVPARLRQQGAAFVSLSVDGALRGCMIDAFAPHEPLYANVLRNTQLAALQDARFIRIQPSEIDAVQISISVVHDIASVSFENPDNLLRLITPILDGVILRIDDEIATYLPSVWETFPDPAQFLSQLCVKAGWPPERWMTEPYPQVETYRVSEFAESTETGSAANSGHD